MSWHFSRALVAEFSGGTCSAGEPSAPSSSTPTQPASSSPAKTTARSRRSQSGTTSEPSTDGPGLASWMSSLADSRARTSVAPAKAQASTASAADSGAKCSGWFAKWDRDSSSWKTPQCSLLAGLDVYSETWPRSGTMRSGSCWVRTTLEHRTEGNASGFWPTPVRMDALMGPVASRVQQIREGKSPGHGGGCRNLRDYVAAWSTPTATQHKGWSPGHNRANSDDRLDYTIEREANQAKAGGKLNPTWVEWLMGWPLGWTSMEPMPASTWAAWQMAFRIESEDSKPLATGKCQSAQQMRS